jgi:hypothetical protein
MSDSKVVRPEDALPDGVDLGVMSGVHVRKGFRVAAFTANARNLATTEPGTRIVIVA